MGIYFVEVEKLIIFRYLIYSQLNKNTIKVVLKAIRKLPWDQMEVCYVVTAIEINTSFRITYQNVYVVSTKGNSAIFT